MTELHAGLDLFREQLRDAVAHDLERARRPRAPGRRAWLPALGAAAAAGVAALVLNLGGGPGVPSANAAVMRHLVAALTAPPGTILHERALVTLGSDTQPYELWIGKNAPHAYRVRKWGHEGTGTDGKLLDPAETLRSMAQSGQAHLDAATTYDGIPAYKLTVTGAADPFLNGTAYVARSDYHPLEIDTAGRGEPERIVVQTYEYLPDTAANERLLAP